MKSSNNFKNIRLSSSTARGAFLANRLADIHRRIATGSEHFFKRRTPSSKISQHLLLPLNCKFRSSLTEHNDWFDGEEEETDVEPRETEYEDDMTVTEN